MLEYQDHYGYRAGPMVAKWLAFMASQWEDRSMKVVVCHSGEDVSEMLFRETGQRDIVRDNFVAFEMPVEYDYEVPQGTFEIRDILLI
jgi:hypothetical protein